MCVCQEKLLKTRERVCVSGEAAVIVRLSVRERMCVSMCVYERACGVREREREREREKERRIQRVQNNFFNSEGE